MNQRKFNQIKNKLNSKFTKIHFYKNEKSYAINKIITIPSHQIKPNA